MENFTNKSDLYAKQMKKNIYTPNIVKQRASKIKKNAERNYVKYKRKC